MEKITPLAQAETLFLDSLYSEREYIEEWIYSGNFSEYPASLYDIKPEYFLLNDYIYSLENALGVTHQLPFDSVIDILNTVNAPKYSLSAWYHLLYKMNDNIFDIFSDNKLDDNVICALLAFVKCFSETIRTIEKMP